jgi:hypothetical protein
VTAAANGDRKLTKGEFTALADLWFDKLDPDGTGALNQEQFIAKVDEILPPPEGFGPGGRGPQNDGARPDGGRPGGGPRRFPGPALFAAADGNKDGSLARAELRTTFDNWFSGWDTEKSGSLNEETLRNGLNAVLPRPDFGGPDRRGGGRGPGRPGSNGGLKVKGVELDPLVAAADADKPLLSKLLAVPALRTRYVGYVRDIAEKQLDWKKLGPLVTKYQALIKADVIADTRKLYSSDEFPPDAVRAFVEGRRAFLLSSTPGRGQ